MAASRTIWGLQKCGAPYRVYGSVGVNNLDDFIDAGGNTIRTYDHDQLIRSPSILDEAHKRGISVIVGIKMQPETKDDRFPAFVC